MPTYDEVDFLIERTIKENEKNFICKCFQQATFYNDIPSMQELGSFYYDKNEYDLAEYWITKAASKGDVVSQNTLVHFYEHAKPNNEYLEFWLEKVTNNNNNQEAANKLAQLYYNKNNYEKALYWFSIAKNKNKISDVIAKISQNAEEIVQVADKIV